MIAGRWKAIPGAELGSDWIVGRYANLKPSDGRVVFQTLCDEDGYVRMFATERLAEAAILVLLVEGER